MASDLKTEIFAYKWFHRKVLGSELSSREYDVVEVYKDEYLANPECIQASESDYLYEAIGLRVWLFQKIYLVEIQTQINEFRHSQRDFNFYVLRTCKRVDLFGNLKIFDRVFATCAFVCCLCRYCYQNGYSEIVRYGYISWAVYFDDFTDEFYKLGGWTHLKMVALSYKPPNDFLDIEKAEERADITVIKIRKVINSYNLFKKFGEIDHDKNIAGSWVKFYIQCINGSSNNDLDQFSDESHSNVRHCSEVENSLKQLKYLCDPNASEIIKNLGQKSTTNSLETSKANHNICDKYVKFHPKEEIISTSELKQNTTFENLAYKSAKKLSTVEEKENTILTGEMSSTGKNAGKENSNKTQDNIRKEQGDEGKEEKKNMFLIKPTASTENNAEKKNSNKNQDDTGEYQNQRKLIKIAKRSISSIGKNKKERRGRN